MAFEKQKKKKKVSPRRQQVRNSLAAERFARLSGILNSTTPINLLILLLFIAATAGLLILDTAHPEFLARGFRIFKAPIEMAAIAWVVLFVCVGAAIYLSHYKPRLLQRPGRLLTMAVLFWLLLVLARLGALSEKWAYLTIGTAAVCAIILTMVFDQRFALGMSMFFSILACFSVENVSVGFFLTMMAGVAVCCFLLREIRTRMKLIEVGMYASVMVFLASVALGIIQEWPRGIISFRSGLAAAVTLAVGVFVQAFLPLIERAFGIATSMTLMDYSDANQPLLKKLAMEAPGTFSHSLLIGSIAETAAEAIGANGLLCRVGAYYHDIGKINKPAYFVENQMGSTSRHEQLSPAMSQLVIVGHVKDGIEIAEEFGLPAILRQFIETHHGTTLMEYFYNEARKKQGDKSTVSEMEFRYPGPKPRSKEAAIVMLADAAESAARSLTEATPTKVEVLVHGIAMKRLQDGQFDDCDLTLRELSLIETSLSKSLAAHHHGRIAYPKIGETEEPQTAEKVQNGSSV